MIIDCHVHLSRIGLGEVHDVSRDILKSMDKAKIDKICLISAPPIDIELRNQNIIYKRSEERQRESIEAVAKITADDRERLMGIIWIDPLLPHAKEEIERAIVDYKLRGIKMLPDHWYPYEERILPVYDKIQEAGVPIIFHSGMLGGFNDSSRFCRPSFFEVLLHFPKIKFSLAHMGSPWIDECIATSKRFRHDDFEVLAKLAGRVPYGQNAPRKESQMFIDITPGPTGCYRTDCLRKAITKEGEDRLIFGTDAKVVPGGIMGIKEALEKDIRIFNEELRISNEAQEKILGKNVMRMFEK